MNAKQAAFVEYYLQCWNASEAARLAGYSVANADVVGSRLLVNVGIKAAINARIEQLKMSANEVLVRLAEHARGDILDFIDDEGRATIAAMRAVKKGRLIKKIKHTERTFGSTDFPTTEKTLELELYDAQAALVQIGKVHRLFAEKVEGWQDDLIRALRDGSIKPKDVIDELGPDAASALLVAAGVSGDEGTEADPESGDETESENQA